MLTASPVLRCGVCFNDWQGTRDLQSISEGSGLLLVGLTAAAAGNPQHVDFTSSVLGVVSTVAQAEAGC